MGIEIMSIQAGEKMEKIILIKFQAKRKRETFNDNVSGTDIYRILKYF
jgi:hypothetical protein